MNRILDVSTSLFATIARLGEQGRLDIDDSIGQYVAGLPAGPAPTCQGAGHGT